MDDAYRQLSQLLTDYIDGNPEKMVVLSLNENDEDILYRDEKRIQDIFTDLLVKPNVRIKSAGGDSV